MNPPIHPICRLFPRMPEEELNRLAEDIRRRRAVLALQVLPHLQAEARERRREGARNSRRAQNCALLQRPARRRKITAAGEAARLLGASPRYVQAARRLARLCPSLLPLVMEGRMALCQALRAANLDGATLRRVMEKTAAAPPNEDISLRRLIWRARDYSGAFGTIKSRSEIEAERAASTPAPPPEIYHFDVTLDSDKLDALDRGEVIHLIVANRRCVVRLRDPPSPQPR